MGRLISKKNGAESTAGNHRFYISLFLFIVIIILVSATVVITAIILAQNNGNGNGLELEASTSAINGNTLLTGLSLELLCLDFPGANLPFRNPHTDALCDCVNKFKPPPFKTPDVPPDFMDCMCDVVNQRCEGVVQPVKGVCNFDFRDVCPNA